MNSLLCRAFTFGLVMAAAVAAQADTWPSRPVRLIVPFTAGSFTDTAARALGRELSLEFKQQFVVDNRVGASGTMGAEAAARASPDGYTLIFAENSIAIAPALYKKLSYDPLKDIEPLAQLAEAPAVLIARRGLPAHSLPDLIQLARDRPGTLNYGSAGAGTSSHLGMEALRSQGGVDIAHIPFKGVSAAMVEAVAGRIDVAIGSIGSTIAYVQDGRLQGLAVSGQARTSSLPGVKTFAEQGFPDFTFMYWFGLMGPSGMPRDVVVRLQEAVQRAAAAAELRRTLEAAGATPTFAPGQSFGKRVRDEALFWTKVVQQAGISPP